MGQLSSVRGSSTVRRFLNVLQLQHFNRSTTASIVIELTGEFRVALSGIEEKSADLSEMFPL